MGHVGNGEIWKAFEGRVMGGSRFLGGSCYGGDAEPGHRGKEAVEDMPQDQAGGDSGHSGENMGFGRTARVSSLT